MTVTSRHGAWTYGREFDVCVIGGGPAGAVAAFVLAGLGRSVVVIERSHFPRDKVCGGCLNRRALAALRDAGLSDVVSDLDGVDLNSLNLCCGGSHARLSLPRGLAVSRKALDAALLHAASQAGALCAHGWTGSVGAIEQDRRVVRVQMSSEAFDLRTKYCVVATGLGELRNEVCPSGLPRPDIDTNSRIGVGALVARKDASFEPGVINMAVARQGYVGITCVEEDMLNAAAAVDAEFVKTSGGPAEACARILSDAGMTPPDGFNQAKWRGTPALTRTVTPLTGPRMIVIGDAGGYVEPFTGEGMAWAISGAYMAARLVHERLSSGAIDMDQAWQRWHTRNVAAPQSRCRLVARALRSPIITGAGIRTLRAIPAMAAPFVGLINAPINSRGRNTPWA